MIVPGIWDSDAEHWQSRWQAERGGAAVRIAPSSWSEPEAGDWRAAIDRAVASTDAPPVLVAHSLGVLAVASWLADAAHAPVAGAFLVAPPDPVAPDFPAAARGFTEPTGPVGVPTCLVVSEDDPYCSVGRARAFGRTMGADVVSVGRLGHVNVASGIGAWASGRTLLEEFEHSL